MDNMTKLVGVLKKDLRGKTIADLSQELSLTRNTIAILLAELKGAQQIEIREVGMAKLHYWRGK